MPFLVRKQCIIPNITLHCNDYVANLGYLGVSIIVDNINIECRKESISMGKERQEDGHIRQVEHLRSISVVRTSSALCVKLQIGGRAASVIELAGLDQVAGMRKGLC